MYRWNFYTTDELKPGSRKWNCIPTAVPSYG